MTNRNHRRISTSYLHLGTNGYRCLSVSYTDADYFPGYTAWGHMNRNRISWR